MMKLRVPPEDGCSLTNGFNFKTVTLFLTTV